MANVGKWIGPIIVIGILGYGAWAFLNKRWPFDGSIMLPTLGGPSQDMMTSTAGGDVSMIQRQIMSNIGSGSHVDPAMLKAQIQQRLAAARAQAAARQAALRAKFPQLQHGMVTG